jgi:hypothetical protein
MLPLNWFGMQNMPRNHGIFTPSAPGGVVSTPRQAPPPVRYDFPSRPVNLGRNPKVFR